METASRRGTRRSDAHSPRRCRDAARRAIGSAHRGLLVPARRAAGGRPRPSGGVVVSTAALAELDELVREIEDPELPHVTIGDLGIVRSITIDGTTATVVLTTTYTGCPATEQIRDDVAAAVRGAGYAPDVRMAISPAWTTDWISERG